MVKGSEQTFFKEDIFIANRHMSYSTSQTIREKKAHENHKEISLTPV